MLNKKIIRKCDMENDTLEVGKGVSLLPGKLNGVSCYDTYNFIFYFTYRGSLGPFGALCLTCTVSIYSVWIWGFL